MQDDPDGPPKQLLGQQTSPSGQLRGQVPQRLGPPKGMGGHLSSNSKSKTSKHKFLQSEINSFYIQQKMQQRIPHVMSFCAEKKTSLNY